MVGTATEARMSTTAAATPSVVNLGAQRRRGLANSFGATVLKCASSFCRRFSSIRSGSSGSAGFCAGLVTVSRTRLIVCFSRS